MARRGWHGVWFLLIAAMVSGCGGALDDAEVPPATPASTAGRKGVVFVGFDASEPLVDAMRQGKIQGLVVQNPLRMGELSVKIDDQAPRETAGRTAGLDRRSAGHSRKHERSRDRQVDSSAAGREYERGEPARERSRRSGG